MDGKKRIARLRNAEGWKKLGFGGFLRQWKEDRVASLKNDMAIVVGLDGPCKAAGPIQKAVGKKKKVRDRDAPRTDGKVWDFWTCTWKTPDKPGRFGSARAMIDALEKRGFKKLGSGHYSTVLAKPGSDKVIKVTRHQDNWIDYVKWASEKGYAGGFAPKVYSWKKFPGDWSWAVMERMTRCVDDSDDSHYNASYSGRSSKTVDDDYSIIFTLLNAACRGNTMAKVYCTDLCPGAFEYVAELREHLRASDIRAANTMVRKDGTLCFTDPCAGETKITKTRLRSGDFSPSVWRYYDKIYCTF